MTARQLLALLPQQSPRQDSTTAQLRDLIAFAERLGCNDAADCLRDLCSESTRAYARLLRATVDEIVPVPAGCPRCGHHAARHSNAREDDYQCEIPGCDCPGWLPSERLYGR